MAQDIIDISEGPPPFNRAEWIGRGRKLPEDPDKVPIGLQYYCNSLLEIPEYIQATHFPAENLNVHDFLKFALPRQTHGFALVRTEKCFTRIEANEDIACLRSRPLPSQQLVTALATHFRQAVLDEMVSVEDPAFPNSRLPLWSISYFKKVYELYAIQSEWRKAMKWLESYLATSDSEVREMANTALCYVAALRWNEKTELPGAYNNSTTRLFAAYLSDDRMMNNDLINMMFAHLAERVEEDDELDSLVVIETLRFMNELDKAESPDYFDKASPKFLTRLEERFEGGRADILILPAYLKIQKHWLVFKLDFEAYELSYGDSLAHKGMAAPKDLIRKLQWWLKKRIGRQFKEMGDQLEHGRQEDWTDCGVISPNTAAHEVFNDELWTCERKVHERLRWFLTLCRAHIEDVNKNIEREKYTTHLENTAGDTPPMEPRTEQNPPRSLAHLLNPLSSAPAAATATTIDEKPSALDAVPMDVHNANAEPEQTESQYASPEKSSGSSVGQKQLYSIFPNVQRPKNSESNARDSGKVKTKKRPSSSEPNKDKPKRKVGKTSSCRTAASSRGESKSATWERARREKYQTRELEANPDSEQSFNDSILQLDKYAYIADPMHVRHMKCGRTLTMKAPYNTRYFRKHVTRCKGPAASAKLPGGGMQPIHVLFSKGTSAAGPKEPCPGLDETIYPDVAAYLERTGALGGGASSVTAIANEMYGKKFRNLSTARKDHVRMAQRHEWSWTNDHSSGRVIATKCTKVASAAPAKLKTATEAASRLLPCGQCLALLKNKRFKNATQVPQPPDSHYKYLNKQYRNKKLASLYGQCTGLRELIESKNQRESPFMRYAMGVFSGKHKVDDLFASLLQAVVLKQEKEELGVGMQGFQYSEKLMEWAEIMFTHSPRAYENAQEHLPLPNPRTLQMRRARQPRFLVGIQERTFALVADTLKQLEYSGPVALSCDDTKLLASFRPYYDKDQDAWFIMGHVGEPYRLLDHQSFRAVTESGQLQKATKLRLFCLQVPVAKIPTIIVAALAIPDNLTAEDLFVHLWAIITGFREWKIPVSSYSTDGSNTERKLARLLEDHATHTSTTSIQHGCSGHPPITIRIPFFGTYPIATVQDPKHLLKTFRNNLYSGARLLTFPNHVAHFAQVREMSLANDSPIYPRDVDRADRQDDAAATRLFSADALKWFTDHRPEQLGIITYLFVLGELIDAYQNRSMPLVTRVQMVLRAHYFIELWEKFLDVAEYPKAKHYVSPQCVDITRILIHGFLQLIVIYRDHYGARYPLLPWLLSTEVVEHIFGICRQIVKDFTMLDFHYMIPKLFVRLREKLFSSRITDGKARASGYSHTYTDHRGIDLAALSAYPANEEIDEASLRAYGEAESLFALLGVSAAEVNTSSSQLPGIRRWFFENNEEDTHDSDEDDDDDDDDDEDDQFDYQQMLDILEDSDLSLGGERVVRGYRYANIALSIDEQEKISSLPELDAEAVTEAYSDDAARIATTLAQVNADTLPPVNINEPENPFNYADPSDIDPQQLPQLRFAHQTKQAASGIRTSKTRQQPRPTISREPSLREKFAENMVATLKEREEKGITAGVDRLVRWTWREPAPGGREGRIDGTSAPALASGNSANAAVNATANAKKILKHRMDTIKKFELPDVLSEARINSVAPLRVADWSSGSGYGFILTLKKKITVCQVLSIYSKTGGSNGRHCYVTDSSNIAAVSNIAVQVFENSVGSQFRSIPHSQVLHAKRFDFIPSSAFLCTLINAPVSTENGLKLSANDWTVYTELNSKENLPKIVQAVMALQKRASNAVHDD
ncbi:hypothetical protein LshimejAT787_1201700 [Lyophyllum shimeji]|uniref:THAP9-like helix-turn-helix domain-containing protein n=1 Tax=Lyophyllum shimeji TaxID=47721 RepID=A0A9P3PWY5_LYOSH|nr:hypothetical protein LshimejAT787_1201700 [Lyophyllum shimeji]